MKRTVLVTLAVCALLALMAGTAFAQGWDIGSYPGTAQGGHTWGDPSGTGLWAYFNTTGNPHGGFDTGTHNCTVCHSVHHANPAGEALLPSTVGEACVYCHITSSTGYIVLYDGVSTNYTDANDMGHNLTGMSSGCTQCHQVHAAKDQMVSEPYQVAAGANSATDYLVMKLLKVNGSGNDMVDSAGAVLKLADGMDNSLAVSYWCTTCHYVSRDLGAGLQPTGYYNAGYGSWTHVMGAVTNDYSTTSGFSGTIAQSASTTCKDCHNRGVVNASPAPPAVVSSTYNYPHYTDGVRMLTSATALDAVTGIPTASGGATDGHADGVCINCHRGAAVTSGGVGMGW